MSPTGRRLLRGNLRKKRFVYKLRPANCVGICDEDYRGEYMVALHNDSDTPRIVQDGERIAQLVVHKRYDMEFEEVDALEDTDRGEGGFGSTGKN